MENKEKNVTNLEDKALEEVNGGFGLITYKPHKCPWCGSEDTGWKGDIRVCYKCGYDWKKEEK